MLRELMSSIAAPFGDGSKNDFRPRAWPRTMWRSTVRCSSSRPDRSAPRPCAAAADIGKKLNGGGLHGDRARRVAETGDLL